MQFEDVFRRTERHSRSSKAAYDHFVGAWSGLSYRFVAACEYEAALTSTLERSGGGLTTEQRYQQERDLFSFFSNCFSVFESTFYGLFSLGALILPSSFPMTTARDQQQISPTTTAAAMARAFNGDPILGIINSVISDPDYLELREVRNILTHRAAPGRTFFVGIGTDDAIPDQWKLKNISLDAQMAKVKRSALARLVSELMRGIDRFAAARL